jgi:membrane-associated phospholipid phosphatase
MKRLIACMAAVCLMTGSLFAQVEPHAGMWKTWVIASGDTLRLPAPPDAEITSRELKWVKDCVSQRDQAALDAIHYWDAGAPAYRWMQLTQQIVVNAGLAAPLQTRALALVAAAISDSTVAAWDSKYAYNRAHPSNLDPTIQPAIAVPPNPSYPSEHAVTAGAAVAVLESLFPEQAGKLEDMAYDAATSRIVAGVSFPSDVFSGLELGHDVGKAVAAFGQSDGSNQVFSGVFSPQPGVWSSNMPVTPLAGLWRPWVPNSFSDAPLPAPPAFGSNEANAQYSAVKNLNRTNAVNHLAWFWQPGFFQPWLQQVDLEIFQNHLDQDAPLAARAYAYETIAQHDATIACWATKYAFLELRPSQADPTITPLFANPQHPGYPSGHACASGAAAAILSALFPADTTLFTAMANDAGTSTFDAGIHTPLDVSEGLKLGSAVGRFIAGRASTDGANR